MPSKFGTVNGHTLFECSSAMQKSIRRGMVEEAVYFAVELDISGYGGYCWRRLRVITSEDVGLADLHLPATIEALHSAWEAAAGRDTDEDRLFLVHAVVLLATSAKSRAIDNLVITEYALHRQRKKEVPDWAYDVHTAKGKRMGRDFEHFFNSSAQVDRAADDRPHAVRVAIRRGDDPWEPTARGIRLAGMSPEPKRTRNKTQRQASLKLIDEEGGKEDG